MRQVRAIRVANLAQSPSGSLAQVELVLCHSQVALGQHIASLDMLDTVMFVDSQDEGEIRRRLVLDVMQP